MIPTQFVRRSIAGLLVAWLFVMPSLAQDVSTLLDEARELVQLAMETEHYPGLSVAVSVDGEVIWSEAFGYADIENQVPMTTDSKFRIGSISKPFTATAIAQLVANGSLDLDAPVQRYVPSFPEKKWTITTRQLGGHLAGIRHYVGNEMMSDAYYPTVQSGLSIFSEDPLIHEPGSTYFYSSYGWNLISAVVEGASEINFLDYMQHNVFSALGMEHTEADFAAKDIENRVSYYERGADGMPELSPYVDNSYKWAGGGFLSTPLDILLFANAYLGNELFDEETKAILFTSQKTTAGEETGYGIGWSFSKDKKGRTLLGHTGGSVGGTSIFQMNPEQNVVVALTINQSSASLGVGRDLMQLILDNQ